LRPEIEDQDAFHGVPVGLVHRVARVVRYRVAGNRAGTKGQALRLPWAAGRIGWRGDSIVIVAPGRHPRYRYGRSRLIRMTD
jgi:hypothetical protein